MRGLILNCPQTSSPVSHLSIRPPLDGERYLTDREVAELLRVSRRTLQEYRNNRVLPFILLGGKVLYPESGLRELLEANYRKPME